ncbi:putative phosphoglycerate mutase family protein [Pisolithus tinctorius]|nr:putative phosphoglycerate mutase family protein [Pisolithus tinctorius]
MGHRENEEAYNTVQVMHAPHEAKLSHELIAGAASFAAMKAYNDHLESQGKPASHAMAKELLAGFAGVAVDRLVETKGLDKYDEYKERKHLKEQAERHAHGSLERHHYEN